MNCINHLLYPKQKIISDTEIINPTNPNNKTNPNNPNNKTNKVNPSITFTPFLISNAD